MVMKLFKLPKNTTNKIAGYLELIDDSLIFSRLATPFIEAEFLHVNDDSAQYNSPGKFLFLFVYFFCSYINLQVTLQI